MPKGKIEKTGNYLRVGTWSGIKPVEYRYQDVGEKGHTQRLAGKLKSGKWITYGWIFKLRDIKNRRKSTMAILRSLKIKDSDLKKFGL